MRFAIRQFVNDGDFMFNVFIGESKRRMYLLTYNQDGKITGFKKFPKESNEGYFLIYGEDDKNES